VLYSDPELYDLAFGHRDIADECGAILAIARSLGVARPRRVVEIACGPAHHLRELARRGLAAHGVDMSPHMLRYARVLCRRERVKVDLRRGDMRSFRIPAKADIALCLYDSFVYCTTDADALAALRAVGAALKPGGVFILELTHPADFFNVPGQRRTLSQWTRPFEQGKLRTRFAISKIDPLAQTYVAKIDIDVFDGRGLVTRRVRERLVHRMWLWSSIERIALESGLFAIAGKYGAIDPAIPLSMSPDASEMVVALRRCGGRRFRS
jgi:SAM-dependent methyltransferase